SSFVISQPPSPPRRPRIATPFLQLLLETLAADRNRLLEAHQLPRLARTRRKRPAKPLRIRRARRRFVARPHPERPRHLRILRRGDRHHRVSRPTPGAPRLARLADSELRGKGEEKAVKPAPLRVIQ